MANKKVFKLATASAVAASALVAAVPASAASAPVTYEQAEKQVNKAREAANGLHAKYTREADYKTVVDSKEARDELARAKAKIAALKDAKQKAYLNTRIQGTVDTVARANTYNNAVRVAVTYLPEAKKALEAALVNVDTNVAAAEEAKTKYDLYVKQAEINFGKVYGAAIQAKFKEMYLTNAVYDLQKDAAAKIADAKLGPAVKSVSAINGKEFVVVFNRAVDATEATTAGNYTFNDTAIGTPELSEDGKTVTITSSSVIDVKNATLTISPIKLKDDTTKTTAKYVTLFTYADTVAPTVAKVEAKDSKAVITFNEELNGTPGLTLNGVTYTDVTVSGKTLTINGLTDEKSYNVEVVGAKDAAGNLANPINLGFTVGKPDAVQPQAVSTSVNQNKVTLSFVNALSTTNVAKVVLKDGKTHNTDPNALSLDGTAATGVKYSEDKKTVVIDVQAIGDLTGVNFLTTDISVSGAGLAKTATTNATLTSDKTSARLVASQTTAAGKLVLEFNEDVQNPATLDLKVTSVDGIYQSTPIAWDGAVVAFAKDTKGNDITTKLEVTLPASAAVGKNYTVEVPASVKDVYDNATDKFSVSVVKPATDNTVKPDQIITVGAPTVAKNTIKLTFAATKDNKGVTSDALVAGNYTLGGKALPTGTVIRYVDDKNNVEIVLPEGAIKTSGDYVLTMKNIKDEVGNTLVAGADKATVKLVENVAPVATALTLKSSTEATVTFSEAIQFNDVDGDVATVLTVEGITVKVNGKPVAVTIAPTDIAASTLTIKGLDLKVTDSVSVEFKDAEIADNSTSKNILKDSVISK